MPRKPYGLRGLEVTPRFELGNEGFADPCLTTWLCHRMEKGANALLLFHLERATRKAPLRRLWRIKRGAFEEAA